jgi:hypothetical protein
LPRIVRVKAAGSALAAAMAVASPVVAATDAVDSMAVGAAGFQVVVVVATVPTPMKLLAGRKRGEIS